MWAVYGQNDDTPCIRMSVYDKNADSVQVRRQEVCQLASRVAQLASGGPGAAQGSQKPWGIWSKTLRSIFRFFIQTFRKSCFSKMIFKDFHQFYTN